MKHVNKHCLQAISLVGALAVAGGAMANEDGWEKMDRDRDGQVSAAESDAAAREMHQKLDADGDGRISLAELQAGHAEKSGDKAHHAKGAEDFAEKLRKMDADNDGAVSADEFAATAREKHGEGDTNGDGNISRAEFDAAKDRMKDKKRAGQGGK